MAELIGNVVAAVKRAFEKKAHLEVVHPQPAKPELEDNVLLCFNPTELQLSKQNTFAEVGIPGLMAPPIQYVRGASEKLSFDAIVDTSDEMVDVREKYVKHVRKLLDIDGRIHAPPVVRFVWESFEFVGVLESLNVTYTLFSDTGKPLRAKLSIALKQYTTVEEQVALAKKQSPDVEKTYVVRRGDTLSRIAEKAYADPAQWRVIARANGIDDPRVLQPGALLTIPRLEALP
jgi:LysM repeat protein